MAMQGIERVLERIQEIESRFVSKQGNQEIVFDNVLTQEMKAGVPPTQNKTLPEKISKYTGQDGTGSLAGIVRETARRYGVDPALVDAIAQTESNYTTDAVSSAGAIGVMQLMPGTAASLGVTDPYDPKQNIEGGVKYIKELLDTFHGDVTKAVAAYNAGPQAVQNYGGVPPYAETKNYVKKVLDIYS